MGDPVLVQTNVVYIERKCALIFGILLLVVIVAIYYLFIEGWLWRLILGTAGWFGIWIGLQMYYPASKAIAGSFSGYSFSWAVVVPTIIVILCLLTTKSE